MNPTTTKTKLKMLIFPFAGGNKYSFNELFRDNFSVLVLEPAGKVDKGKKVIIDFDLLIEDLFFKI